MDDQRDKRQYRRIGDTAKCPACGWRMDAEAYRCPKCYIYFCFKCRARVTEREPQFQCADQSCPCYGKLLCPACTVIVPEYKDVTRTTYRVVSPGKEAHSETRGCAVVAAALIVGAFAATGFMQPTLEGHHWLLGIVMAGFGVFWGLVVLVFLSSVFPTTWFEIQIPAVDEIRERCDTTENMQVAEHRCCIQCKHPIKALRQPGGQRWHAGDEASGAKGSAVQVRAKRGAWLPEVPL